MYAGKLLPYASICIFRGWYNIYIFKIIHCSNAEFGRNNFKLIFMNSWSKMCLQCRHSSHRYASTSILHIGWYSYTLIYILVFKIHFVFAFFADYTLIHIFKPIHTHFTLTVETPVQAYIYMLIQSVIDTYI